MSIEHRIATLAYNIDRLDDDITDAHKRIGTEELDRKAEIGRLRGELDEAKGQLTKLSEDKAARGVPMAAAGLTFAAMGLALQAVGSTPPPWK